MRLVLLSILSVALQGLTLANPASGAPVTTTGTAVTTTTVSIPGLMHPVRVALDASGVAHISARSEHDVFVAQGYYEAENRLFQMEFQAMLASGRLSDWVGALAKGTDTAQELLQVPSNAELTDAFYKARYPKYYSYLEDFSLGVNDYIRQGYVPLGFRLLKKMPFPWRPLDTLYWASYFGKGATTGLGTELRSSLLYGTLGYRRTESINPYYPPFTLRITAVPGDGRVNGYSLTDRGVSPRYLWSQNWYGSWATGVGRKQLQALQPLIKEAISNVGDPWPGYDFSAPGTGSNVWVVAGSHSTTGHPLLANDPHLSLLAPSIWLPVALSAPGLHVSGWSLVDIPGVLIGHTPTTAWGGTNAGGTTTEPYLERLNGNDYYFDGRWYPMQATMVDIDGQSVPIYSTNNGPLIARQNQWGISLYSDNRLPSMAFVDEIRLDKAQTYASMLQSFSTWNTGPRNWAFATRHHIGFVAATRYPLISERLPDGKPVSVVLATGLLSGSGGHEVSGYVPFKYLPQVEDPRQGFVYAPNQPTVGEDYPYPIIGGGIHSSGGRAETIAHYLASHPRMSPRNMMDLQSSIRDYWASQLTPYILSALRGSSMNATEAAAFSDLASWRYEADLNSTGMTIYYYLLDELYAMSFDAVLTAHGLPVSVADFGSSTVLYLARHDPHSMWFNGSWTGTVRQAFAASTSFLSGSLGTAVSGWKWHKVHQVLFQDLLRIPSLAIGPVGLWGDNHTVSAGYTSHQLKVPEPFVSVGPSLRFVASPHTRQYWGVFPGGASEHVGSPWHANQLPKWLAHRYYDMTAQPTVAITTYR